MNNIQEPDRSDVAYIPELDDNQRLGMTGHELKCLPGEFKRRQAQHSSPVPSMGPLRKSDMMVMGLAHRESIPAIKVDAGYAGDVINRFRKSFGPLKETG